MNTMQTGDDPGEFTVAEVTEHLAASDAAERDRVLDAERAGKARKGILEPKVGETSTAVRSNVQPGVDLETGERDAQPGEEAVADAVEERAQRYEDLGDHEAAARTRERLAPTDQNEE